MGVRLVSIPLIFVLPFPWNIVPILLAVFIPAFAVVLANASGSKPMSSMDGFNARELTDKGNELQ
jgi:hypothetical protein